jgi:hypothetical protein
MAKLKATEFTEAKGRLSDLMTDVVQQHRPQLISRHRGKEEMILLGVGDLLQFLADVRFEPEVNLDGGEFTAALTDLGLLGYGESLEGAMEDLVNELSDYARRFFESPQVYMASDRRRHASALLKVALTPDHDRMGLIRPPLPTR